MEVPSYLEEVAAAVEAALDRLLAPAEGPAAELWSAMRYSTLEGGKRLRPALLAAAAEGFGATRQAALAPAVAIELVHAYSLVHDDLPAMDDAVMRRGRPSTHRRHGEACAILAGDALLTLAFEVLARAAVPAGLRAELAAELAAAAGGGGMVAGQAAELAAAAAPDLDGLLWVAERKTAALFAGACRMGGLVAGAPAGAVTALGAFGMRLGVAFQVLDDLDDEDDPAAAASGATFPAVLGRAGAADLARRELQRARAALAGWLPGPAERVAAFADWLEGRLA